MASSLSTGQSQRRDSESSGSDAVQDITTGSAQVVPEAKTSGQKPEGEETIPSSTTTIQPVSSSNASYKSPNSPQPSNSPSASQRGANNWSLVVPNVPEEVKAIVRTGMHAWSRGIVRKGNTTATSTSTSTTTTPATRG